MIWNLLFRQGGATDAGWISVTSYKMTTIPSVEDRNRIKAAPEWRIVDKEAFIQTRLPNRSHILESRSGSM